MSKLLNRSLILPGLFNIDLRQHELDWQPFHKGIEIFRLYDTEDNGPSAALLRYQPGAVVPNHKHLGFEHILVLSGSQTDYHGSHEAGTLVINPPGTTHDVQSKNGCIVLAIWEKPVLL